MDKLKIAVTQSNTSDAAGELIRSILGDTALLELCSPILYDAGKAEAALRDVAEGKADALVHISPTDPAHPADAIEIIATDKIYFMPIAKEPTAEDVANLRNILERDFDIRSPRIAIVQETSLQNPDLANQVTAEQGINTYGPYTVAQILEGNKLSHFDGIIAANGKTTVQNIVAELALEAPVRYFAGKETVVTAVCKPSRTGNPEEGLADVSAWTHPFYTAFDVIRNRAHYDEARQNPLQKLFRDKRDDKKKDDASQANARTPKFQTEKEDMTVEEE